MQGKVIIFNEARGFGFIRIDFRTRIFFHCSRWASNTPPMVGQLVEFEIGPGQAGKGPQAINVRPVGEAAVNLPSAFDSLAGQNGATEAK